MALAPPIRPGGQLFRHRGPGVLLETPAVEHHAGHAELHTSHARLPLLTPRSPDSTSLRALIQVISRRRRLVLFTLGSLLFACLLYCLIVPPDYEAQARVALRTIPASSLS